MWYTLHLCLKLQCLEGRCIGTWGGWGGGGMAQTFEVSFARSSIWVSVWECICDPYTTTTTTTTCLAKS